MRAKTFLIAVGFTVLLFASSCIASASAAVSIASENSLRISSGRLVRALDGGSFVTGTTEPSVGYVAPRASQVHVMVYDANGKLLGEKIDNINGNDLVRWHLRPAPHAHFTVFFPWPPTE